MAPVVNTVSITIGYNKIQNVDILAPANSDSRGKMADNTERQY